MSDGRKTCKEECEVSCIQEVGLIGIILMAVCFVTPGSTNHEVSVTLCTGVSARCHTELFGTVARFLLREVAGEDSDSNKLS